IILFPGPACAEDPDIAERYGATAPDDFLSGKFDPTKHPQFISLKTAGIPERGYAKHMHRIAAADLKRLIEAFRKDHPDIELYVTSATRNYWSQKGIWEQKWNGNRKVSGMDLSKSVP